MLMDCDYIDNLLESHKLIIDCQYVSESKDFSKKKNIMKKYKLKQWYPSPESIE